ncbi:DUF2785 domain-containing protein [Salimicrobium halophilum]|uniref:DUF2785 domain-containing protein n=1 Tax=Salimicrobium halophilum TaxID=86666 RepID=A0A1G8RH71_9BACI|nr:DUF2785 domain-containing protein [Salimicrobium halophilum]SDJ15845.1 Protein of unknown function [Salimicrobium halophilum]
MEKMKSDAEMKTKIHEILNDTRDPLKSATEYETILEIVGVLGSTDAELRDELGYETLLKLLVHKNYLNGHELKRLLQYAISDNMLLHDIGRENEDSVFLRSFSALLVTLLLHRDNQDEYLSKAEYDEVVHRIVDYCEKERDFRGFVPEKGWAHAPAHISDAIDECVKSRYVDIEVCRSLWEGLKNLLLHAPFVYSCEEDERMAIPMLAMLDQNHVTLPTLRTWLTEVSIAEEPMHTKINFKHFTRCITTRLLINGETTEYREMGEELEYKYNPTFSQL